MNFRILFVTAAVLTCISQPAAAQNVDASRPPAMAEASPPPAQSDGAKRLFAFRDFAWFEPLVADPRAARVAVTFPAFAKRTEFAQDEQDDWRYSWDISVGVEAPMIGWRSSGFPTTSEPRGDRWFEKGDWAIGVWIPISFHVLEDHVDPSAPIVNTDYRFGSMVKARIGLVSPTTPGTSPGAEMPARPWALALRLVPFFHESTHLGDEYSLEAQRLFPDRFRRVNVSYEYWELLASLETTELAIRGGLQKLHGNDGYYSDHLLGSENRDFEPTSRNYEPIFGIEWAPPHRAASGEAGPQNWALFASADVRWKTVYNYLKLPGQGDESQASLNLAVGWRRDPTDRTLGLRQMYFRFYHGVNPHGQLRNQKDFTLFAVGFNFGM